MLPRNASPPMIARYISPIDIASFVLSACLLAEVVVGRIEDKDVETLELGRDSGT